MNKNNAIRPQGLGVALLLMFSGFLVACSGSSSSDSDTGSDTDTTGAETGVFIDSPVAGLNYETASRAGTTDAQGQFHYEPGEIITFFIGETPIGVVPGAPVTTPYDLVEGADEQALNRAINIARLLQSLDEDLDPSTGIRLISGVDELPSSLNFDDESALANALAQVRPGVALVDAETARAHMDASIAEAIALPADEIFHSVTRGQWLGRFAQPDVSCMAWNDATVTMTQQEDGSTRYEGSITGAGGINDVFAFTGSGRNSTGQSQGGELINVGLHIWPMAGGTAESSMMLGIGDAYGCVTQFVLKGENAENQRPVSYVSQLQVGVSCSAGPVGQVRRNDYTINSYDRDGYIADAPVYYEIRNGQETGPFPMTATCLGDECEQFNDRPPRRIDLLTIDDIPCDGAMDRTIEVEVTDNEGASRRVRIATAEESQEDDTDIGGSDTFQFCADDYPILYCEGVNQASDEWYWWAWDSEMSCSELTAEAGDIGADQVIENWSNRDDTLITLPNGDVIDPEPGSPGWGIELDTRGTCCISTEYEGCPQ